LRKSPLAPGRDRTPEARRSRGHRDRVRRRGEDRPEEQDHASLGQTWSAAERAKRPASAYVFGAICPKEAKAPPSSCRAATPRR
jgi:hypothetical protein